MKKLLICLFPFILSSCQPIARLVFGIKKPQYETYESINTFCAKNGMDTTNLFVPKRLWFTKSESIKYNYEDTSKIKFVMPAVLAFNADGKALTLHNPGNCTPGAIGALETASFVTDSAALAQPPHAYLSTILQYFENREFENITFEDVKDSSDVYIAFFWPKYAPKISRKKYKELKQVVNSDSATVKYKVLLFNCDLQKWDNS